MADKQPSDYVTLTIGDPAPWFFQRSTKNPNYAFDSVGGRYVVMAFFGSASTPDVQEMLAVVEANRRPLDDSHASFFGVSTDETDESEGRLQESLPGIRYFWDFDRSVSRLYGALPKQPDSSAPAKRFWLILDPMLRVMARLQWERGAEVFKFLATLPPPGAHVGFEVQAPIMILPRVFEPQFCKTLIDAYTAAGGEDSGFMQDVGGKTVGILNPNFKRRKDFMVQDAALINEIQKRIYRRVAPEIAKAYCFKATRMERYLVGCYAAEDGGHFRPHRDNTTKATAHRCFAVSINLNDDFDGGELSFPEFGRRQFKAPPGAALIFPGALLHAVSKVTRGQRYAFLPFVYDDAAAKIREANAKYLEAGSEYKVR